MNKIYNEESSKLINDLKNLPKVNAPDNFEFNLMTRIENKNYGPVIADKPKFSFAKFLAPSAAVVAVIILFFVFYPQNQQIQKQIISQTQNLDTPSIASNSQKISNRIVNGNEKRNSLQNYSAQQNNLSAPSSKQNLINSNRSVAVDDYISGNKSNNSIMQNGNIVNDGQQALQNPMFIEKPLDKKTIERIRAVNDSLKMAQAKADSLKKTRK